LPGGAGEGQKSFVSKSGGGGHFNSINLRLIKISALIYL
jgi:hypothetical protein